MTLRPTAIEAVLDAELAQPSRGPQSRSDAPYYILYGESLMKWNRAGPNGATADGWAGRTLLARARW